VLAGDFARLFVADTVSTLGTVVSTLAMQFLLIDTLHADQREIGVVRAAQWVPYLLFGLLAGVYVDRFRRRPVLVATDIVSAALFFAIGGLALAGRLTVLTLSVLVFAVGAVSCVAVAAYQSYVPRLVLPDLLPEAFARLEQMGATVSAGGPLVAGSLVRFLSAPVAVVVDAVSYVVSAVVLATIRRPEPPPAAASDRHLLGELREGARWVYRHETLRPYALWLHAWFFGNALVSTVVVYYVNQELGLDPLTIGVILAVAGVSGIAAAAAAPRLGLRFGVGRVITVVELVSPTWPVLVAVARPGAFGVIVLVLAHLLAGCTTISASLMMSYRTMVTPDRLRARMNATIRTFNWGGIAIAAPLSGWLAANYGNRTAILSGAGLLALATAFLWLSPYRHAVMPAADPQPTR
jgi:predicted MFS family arabinose efflux permease